MVTSPGVTAAGWRRARIHLIYYNLCLLLLLPLNVFRNSTALIGSAPRRSGEPASAWKAIPARRVPESRDAAPGQPPGRAGRGAASCWAPVHALLQPTDCCNKPQMGSNTQLSITARSRYDNTCPGIIPVTPQL